ncbi:hypothetical protein sos41_22980 [Alphaproteobacteria bacterium SO-S41]|nr:hypothetical protein sos41_22980 [Alphaproteobacteria bacterium SO-S41]
MKLLAVCSAALLLAGAAAAKEHRCAADARAQALKFLPAFYAQTGGELAPEEGEPKEGQAPGVMNWALDETVTALPEAADGTAEVLEVNGFVYKATFRMRFLYLKDVTDSCVLVGEEILAQ